MFYNLYIYIVLYNTLLSVVKRYYSDTGETSEGESVSGGRRSKMKLLHMMPLLLYPLNLLICWVWGTINRMQNWYHPGNPSFVLFLLQVLFGNLQGKDLE